MNAPVQSGDVLAFRGTGFFSWLVRHWTASEWAHVGIAWCLGRRIMVLESLPSGGGVRVVPFAAKTGSVSLVTTGIVWNEVVQEAAVRRLGEPYGWVDAFRAGFGLRPTSKGLQCAEYASEVLGAAGIAPLTAPTPGKLVDQLLALGGEIVLLH